MLPAIIEIIHVRLDVPAGTLMTFMHGLRLNMGEDWVKQVANNGQWLFSCVHVSGCDVP